MGTAKVAAGDLFCGAGGLSWGLRSAGIDVTAGIDVDPNCRYPFETNIKAKFVEQDVATLTADALTELWSTDGFRVLAGCAPCQPFSAYRRGADTSSDDKWPLLNEFGRLVVDTLPEIVTMENVPRIGNTTVSWTSSLRSSAPATTWTGGVARALTTACLRLGDAWSCSRLGSVRSTSQRGTSPGESPRR